MYFATLASGSSGNSILVGQKGRSFLVDSGISAKRLLNNLSLLDISPSQIEGLIVTHEHNDHIKGVGVLARKLKIPVYATKTIWEEMENIIGKLNYEQKRIINREISLAGMDIKLFATSHDSRESFGLKVSGAGLSLGIATDSGTVTEEMHLSMRGCDSYIVEANYDQEKLWAGRYPWHLKKRINSNLGHLSNEQLAEALTEWVGENTRKIVLAHLSEENNTPERALSTVYNILKDSKVRKVCKDLRLKVAPRHTPHKLIILGE
ncbi:MAG: MBL fold metallo-hydrolase [Eubacteriales bacterium]